MSFLVEHGPHGGKRQSSGNFNFIGLMFDHRGKQQKCLNAIRSKISMREPFLWKLVIGSYLTAAMEGESMPEKRNFVLESYGEERRPSPDQSMQSRSPSNKHKTSFFFFSVAVLFWQTSTSANGKGCVRC
ncbi:hypothetical protein CDAR_429061 [Caerostris darwini]|uniref:Uncharacterized protein n=1 Tax=Caerostris darwini TaxID=1538125 RepID=A0AAV4TZB4_9ARAC|nr:hypothetical protein CDAR_429061 [Caerostris darwini]